MADVRDPVAAAANAAKRAHRGEGRRANYTDAFDAPDRQGVMGPDNGPQHRAAPGEGIRAPQGAEALPQTSVFDGRGNESVVVVAEDEQGRQSQGTGPDTASALAEARKGEAHPGSALSIN